VVSVFAFVILLVLITTIGKVVMAAQARAALGGTSPRSEELHQLLDSMSELGSRVEKLEEERDFYRALLEPPERSATRLPPLDGPPAEGAEGAGAAPPCPPRTP
jgi:uncharacterized protein YlxW (UPF0749 family)